MPVPVYAYAKVRDAAIEAAAAVTETTPHALRSANDTKSLVNARMIAVRLMQCHQLYPSYIAGALGVSPDTVAILAEGALNNIVNNRTWTRRYRRARELFVSYLKKIKALALRAA